MTITVFMDRPPCPLGSRKAAIGPEHLRVHPAARGASQERDHVGNVFRPPEALERGSLRNCSICASVLPFRNSSVDTGPGATALTVISRPRSSLASTGTRPSTPAFEAM